MERLLRPTQVMDHDKYVEAPNTQPAALMESTDLLGTKRVDASTLLTYTGRAAEGSSPDDPVWQITRELVIGGETITEHADNANFTQIWNNRAVLFSNPPFNNSRSVELDGVNDFLDLGTPVSLTRTKTNPWSMSMWFRAKKTNALQYIYSKRTGPQLAGISIGLLSGGSLIIDIANTNTLKISGHITGIQANTWYNLVVTYTGSGTLAGLTAYLNGNLAVLSTTLDALGANDIVTTANAYLGQHNASSYLEGYIDDFSNWNTVLTQQDVTDIYNLGEPADLEVHSKVANLLTWLRMGDNLQDDYPIVHDVIDSVDATMTNMTSANFVGVVP